MSSFYKLSIKEIIKETADAVSILFNGSKYNVLESNFWLFMISFILVSFYLSMYIIMKVIPSKAEDYLKETYPEYTLENAN